MRLTVGPLPAAVYWRRRALVAGLLVLLVVMVTYACGGTGAPADAGHRSPSPTPTHTLDLSELGGGGGSATSQPATTGPTFSLPTSAVTGPCTDLEMSVTAAGPATAARGSVVSLTLKFRNVSTRTCTRDIGADSQELRLMRGKDLIWSSDDCNANHGRDAYSFAPGVEREFKLNWNGRMSRSGTGAVICTGAAQPPQIGAYELYGRLATKLSPAVTVRIT